MRVFLVKKAGFCFGVKRAIKLAFDVAKKRNERVHTWGPLIHNPQVVEDLKEKGVYPVEHLREIKTGTLIIRSHGIHPRILEGIKKKKIEVVDATCPFVKKAQKQAMLLSEGGYQVAVVGEADHPEVQGIMGYVKGSVLVINHNRINRNLAHFKKLGVIAQTTLNIDALKQVIGELVDKADELKVCNTICHATAHAQRETLKLAGKVDMMIVVGGHNSANTTRLAKLCRRIGTSTHHIETARELRRGWFGGKSKVGVTAGTSTPDWLIQEVVDGIRKYPGCSLRN